MPGKKGSCEFTAIECSGGQASGTPNAYTCPYDTPSGAIVSFVTGMLCYDTVRLPAPPHSECPCLISDAFVCERPPGDSGTCHQSRANALSGVERRC